MATVRGTQTQIYKYIGTCVNVVFDDSLKENIIIRKLLTTRKIYSKQIRISEDVITRNKYSWLRFHLKVLL